MKKYNKWIDENVEGEGLGKCKEITEKMSKCFPELKRVRGHYICPIWKEREHWWLVTNDGKIVDPTKRQFPSKGIGEYVLWDESKEVPTGKCPNCGKYCFNGKSTCSDECYDEYKAYLEDLMKPCI